MGNDIKLSDKIRQNQSENRVFIKQLDKFFDGKMLSHESINVCSTPNILRIIGSNARKIILSQSDLKNAIAPSEKTSKKHTEGHNIDISELRKLPDYLRNPIMVLKGKANSVIVLTEMKDNDNHNVFIPLALDRQKGKVNNISTLYGKKNLENYLAVHLSDVLAINIKKANLTANIGDQYSKSISGSVVCFDDSIVYTTENVKYPQENIKGNNSLRPQGDIGRKDLPESVASPKEKPAKPSFTLNTLKQDKVEKDIRDAAALEPERVEPIHKIDHMGL